MRKNENFKKDGLELSESKIQQSCVQWYRNTYCLKHHSPRSMIFSIPNEGRKAASAQLIATGLYPGIGDTGIIHLKPDTRPSSKYLQSKYLQIHPIYLFVEFKTGIGVQSDKQKAFQEHCEQMGILYFIVRSLDEFKQVIEKL